MRSIAKAKKDRCVEGGFVLAGPRGWARDRKGVVVIFASIFEAREVAQTLRIFKRRIYGPIPPRKFDGDTQYRIIPAPSKKIDERRLRQKFFKDAQDRISQGPSFIS